jgi:hypothetical protein
MEKSDYYINKANTYNSGYTADMLSLLFSNDIYLISRVGSVEFNACRGEHLIHFPSENIISTKNSIDKYTKKNAGFYFVKSTDVDGKALNQREIFYIFQNKYLNCMFQSNYILLYSFHINDFNNQYNSVIDKFNIEQFYEDIGIYLLLLEYYTCVLKKKVLFVSNFTTTMKSQLSKFKLLFPEYNINTDMFVFYTSYQTIEGNTPHENWYETYKIMENDISNLEFDYVIMGCGCYGLPLCNYTHKNMNKPSFYIGATIQLLFGIGGNRWLKHLRNPKYWFNKYHNEHWVRPDISEMPLNHKQVEDSCYW